MAAPDAADDGRPCEGKEDSPHLNTFNTERHTFGMHEDFTHELRSRLAAIERKLDALRHPVGQQGGHSGQLAMEPQQLGLARAWAGSAFEMPIAPAELGLPATRSLPAEFQLPSEVPEPMEAAAEGGGSSWATAPQATSPFAHSQSHPTAAGDSRAGGANEEEDEERRTQRPTVQRSLSVQWIGAGSEQQLTLSGDKALTKEMSRLTRTATADKQVPWWKRMMTKLGLYETMDSIREAQKNPRSMRGWKMVHNNTFTSFCSAVIVLNALFMGYSASISMTAGLQGERPPTYLFVLETMFAIFFVVELMLRFCVERWLFFVGPELKWNMFDLALVLHSIFDMAISDAPTGANISIGRLLRMFRFIRLARLSRVIRQFDALRLVLYAILDSMNSLFWCFVIIWLAIYVFAVLFLSVAAEHFSETSVSETYQNDWESQRLLGMYGDLYKAMMTLFMVISGGVDWGDAMRPLEQVHTIYGPVFVMFIFGMHFGVLNVVIGTFVAAATEIAARDQEALVKYELREWQIYAERIRSFFQEADIDSSGTLSWEEFRAYLEAPKVRAIFQTLDLGVAQAHVLFDLLDMDRSGCVSVEEFIDGCMRLRGQAKSIDLNMLLAMNKQTFEKMNGFMQWSYRKQKAFEESLDSMLKQKAVCDQKEVLA